MYLRKDNISKPQREEPQKIVASKATLLRTVPGGTLKSSAMDIAVRPFGIAIAMLFIKLYVVG